MTANAGKLSALRTVADALGPLAQPVLLSWPLALRVLDKLRLAGQMADRELSRRRAACLNLLIGIEQIRINRAVLERAAPPFATQVRSLDAAHLASALFTLGRHAAMRFATHDSELALAAQAEGITVIGA